MKTINCFSRRHFRNKDEECPEYGSDFCKNQAGCSSCSFPEEYQCQHQNSDNSCDDNNCTTDEALAERSLEQFVMEEIDSNFNSDKQQDCREENSAFCYQYVGCDSCPLGNSEVDKDRILFEE